MWSGFWDGTKNIHLTIFICGVVIAIARVFSESESPAMLGCLIIFTAFVLDDFFGSNK